jgi:hypothetical protein
MCHVAGEYTRGLFLVGFPLLSLTVVSIGEIPLNRISVYVGRAKIFPAKAF